jgi:hypothetical protein
MEFSWDGILSRAKPAACAASPVDFVARDNAKTQLFRCLLRQVAQRDRAVAIMRPVFSATWRTAADAKSVHDHLSRHHAALIMERARFDISLSASVCMPAHGW